MGPQPLLRPRGEGGQKESREARRARAGAEGDGAGMGMGELGVEGARPLAVAAAVAAWGDPLRRWARGMAMAGGRCSGCGEGGPEAVACSLPCGPGLWGRSWSEALGRRWWS